MNAFENWFCGSQMWRHITEKQLLPWIVSDCALGEHVLEVGAGPGATTRALRGKAKRVTSIELDGRLADRFAERHKNAGAKIVQGDAAALPFAERTFSSVIAILMLHHMKSPDLQNHAFAEFYRVLQPGGMLLAFEIQDAWLHRIGHIRSTFVPVAPRTVRRRLEATGFSEIGVELRRGAYRVCASRG